MEAQYINWPSHSLKTQVQSEVIKCANVTYCDENLIKISLLAAKLVNDYSAIILGHQAQILMRTYFALLPVQHPPKLRLKIEHMLSVLAFSQGDFVEVSALACTIFPPLTFFIRFLRLNDIGQHWELLVWSLSEHLQHRYVIHIYDCVDINTYTVNFQTFKRNAGHDRRLREGSCVDYVELYHEARDCIPRCAKVQ